LIFSDIVQTHLEKEYFVLNWPRYCFILIVIFIREMQR